MRALLTVAWLAAAVCLAWHAAAYKAPAIEKDILARSSEAVKALDAGAEIFADGRFVTVRGKAPDEATKANTLAAANAVWGALGPYDEVVVSAVPKSAAIVLAEKTSDGGLRLSGMVPTQDARTAIEEAAKAAFAGSLDNRLVTGNTEALAADDVNQALKTLASLDTGTVLVDSARVLISGSTSNAEAAAAARAVAASHPTAWQLFLSGPEAVTGRFSAVKLPDGTILASGDIPSEDVRTALLDTLRSGDADRRIVDRLTIRTDSLPETWSDNTMKGVQALMELDWGSVSLDGARSYLAGMAGANDIGAISDGLGPDFTAELTPRPADPTPARISAMERELNAAKSRVLDLSAASSKHLADLNAAESRLDELRKAGVDAKVLAEAASKRVAELEAAAAGSKRDLDSANARIAGLTEMLSLRPADTPLPADALPVPSQSSLEQPKPAPDAVAEQPETTGTLTPQIEQQSPAPAPTVPPVAPAQPPEAEVKTAALSPSQEAERIANGCNAAVGSVLGSASITFESKSAQITREGNDVLDRLIAGTAPCIGNPALKVTIGGHTDSRGQDRDNLRLSKERADSVKESLIVRSIPPDAITAIGYGETLPVADNDTEEGRSANRRITIDWSLR